MKPNISTQNDAMFEAVSIHLPKHQIGMLSMLGFFLGLVKLPNRIFESPKRFMKFPVQKFLGTTHTKGQFRIGRF